MATHAWPGQKITLLASWIADPTHEVKTGRSNAAGSCIRVGCGPGLAESWRSELRRLLIWAPEGSGAKVRELACRHSIDEVVSFAGEGDGPVDLALLHVPNRRVDGILDELSSVEGLHVSMFPHGVLNLKPPPGEAPSQVRDVTLRSPLEIFLGGLQSVGSWRGFLSYAVTSGLVVWVGLYTNTVYLLVAAMLIAPSLVPP